MENNLNIGTIRKQMAEKGISFKKKFGQNFLTNPDILYRISDSASKDGQSGILEIGAGAGSLTVFLAEKYRKVVSVEIDTDLIPLLEENLSGYENIDIISDDIMRVDVKKLVEEYFSGCKGVAVCANLPYYITTPIIMKLLECGVPFTSITVMIQKEVADRLTAEPGTQEYGAVTASCAYYGYVEKLFNVSAGNFMPPPKVDSAVIRINLYGDGKPVIPLDEKTLFSVISGAFAQRRKTLLNTLGSSLTDIGKDNLAQILEKCGISPTVRGEKLSVGQFSDIADGIYTFRKSRDNKIRDISDI